SKLKRIVFKFGTNILKNEDGDISLSRLYSFIEDISRLYKEGREILIVTSGAVGLGAKKLGLKTPESLVDKQAAASIGQPMLIGIYQEGFDRFGIKISQILLTEDDFSNRKRYLSLRSTLSKLLECGIIPVINQNDVILPSELEHVSFSDNDKLSALVASKLDADLLVMVSDIDGLFDKNPKEYSDAKLIPVVQKVTSKIEKLASGASIGGRGGMITKLNAAKVVTNSGSCAMIVNGLKMGIIRKIFTEENAGTLFLPNNKLSSKQRWIAYATNVTGEIFINAGAKTALTEKQKSLLPIGVLSVKGKFESGEVVCIFDENKNEFARGVINYNSSECEKIIGKHSSEIKKILGYMNSDDLINKDNLVVL
ncbi:MAG: glutamate 5-kinase, partial [Candidatus Gastranaerophilales bacterium]|nr:glutamate 5-kinase [Candidatus Gastranaerophilales bacterium]